MINPDTYRWLGTWRDEYSSIIQAAVKSYDESDAIPTWLGNLENIHRLARDLDGVFGVLKTTHYLNHSESVGIIQVLTTVHFCNGNTTSVRDDQLSDKLYAETFDRLNLEAVECYMLALNKQLTQ